MSTHNPIILLIEWGRFDQLDRERKNNPWDDITPAKSSCFVVEHWTAGHLTWGDRIEQGILYLEYRRTKIFHSRLT